MPLYKTFKRSCTDFKSFATARKITVDTGLTYEEARIACAEYHDNRTTRQKRRGTLLEFTAMAFLLALSAPSWATEVAAKPRVKPEASITVKVYPGRPERVSRTQESACVAWVPNVGQLEGGFIACQCALGVGKECGPRKVLKVGGVLQ